MASRGTLQRGRSDVFDRDKPLRAQTVLPPGDPVRAQYEALVTALGVSGAQIIRMGIEALHAQTLKEAG